MTPDLRAAADALKTAIDRHLEACAARSGEEDPKVQEAYDVLRDAAEAYDDLLFETYEEVTPFEFSPGPLYEPTEVAQEGVPTRVSLFARRDFAVRAGDELIAVGRDLLPEVDDEGDPEDVTAADALALYLEVHGLDAMVNNAEDLGMSWLGGTTWVVDQDPEDDTLMSAPFAVVDETRLLHRMDEEVAE
jgi:hypothetical protein